MYMHEGVCEICICMYACVWLESCGRACACVLRFCLDLLQYLLRQDLSIKPRSCQFILGTHFFLLSLELQGVHHIHSALRWVLGIQFCLLLFSGRELTIKQSPPTQGILNIQFVFSVFLIASETIAGNILTLM